MAYMATAPTLRMLLGYLPLSAAFEDDSRYPPQTPKHRLKDLPCPLQGGLRKS